MEWDVEYPRSREPSMADMEAFVQNPYWAKLHAFIEETYQARLEIRYSGCSMQRGWNIRCQKSGKTLCTLYPMQGFFIALVVIGEREKHETELVLPSLSEEIQTLYAGTTEGMGQRWLMIPVRSEAVLQDVQTLIQLRVQPKRKQHPAETALA
ncbi:DUF3788 domain-containing protein [Ruminococcaceae bacterium OttesenSCG-928-L11]|nr:DUF3788 domain-containing protein [Ruminococcaceae bacterium OttesenSCG-928-L11]